MKQSERAKKDLEKLKIEVLNNRAKITELTSRNDKLQEAIESTENTIKVLTELEK